MLCLPGGGGSPHRVNTAFSQNSISYLKVTLSPALPRNNVVQWLYDIRSQSSQGPGKYCIAIARNSVSKLKELFQNSYPRHRQSFL
jgi:hypothetical protein